MPPRIRAALIHLTLSAAVASAVFLPIYFYWYPDVLFEGAGGRDLFFLIVGVDITLGPLITLIIFKPGKKGLLFDLVVIGILQTAALAFGVYTLFESRPVHIAFAIDRFEVVRANAFPDGEIEKARAKGYAGPPWTGPTLVGIRMPTDPDEQFAMMVSGFGGVDVQYYPRYYVPYDDVRAQVVKTATPIATLRKRNPERAAEIAQVLAVIGRKEEDVKFVPMRAGKYDLTVFVDAKTGEILKITSLFPWAEK